MDRKTALKILHDVQKWRRGHGDDMPHSGKVFGEAIDFAIRELRRYERIESGRVEA